MENESTPSRSMSNPESRSTLALRSSIALHQMKSKMSGWSTSRITIFAARLVLPPDLIVPADESAPRMKLTGPDAVPPPARISTEARILLRFTPAPDPPLKMTPSSVYQLRIESIESSTARMKQADPCCGTPFTPMLNQTGELNAAFWWMMRCLSSAANVSASSSSSKYPSFRPQVLIVSTTRSATCLSDHSRSAVPEGPPEVLLGEDVRGVQAPRGGHLDAELLEGHRPVAVVGDPRIASLPDDLVIRVDTRLGEVSTNAERRPLRSDGHWSIPPVPIEGEPTSASTRHRTLQAPQTTTYCGRPPSDHQMQGLLQHCSYATVNASDRRNCWSARARESLHLRYELLRCLGRYRPAPALVVPVCRGRSGFAPGVGRCSGGCWCGGCCTCNHGEFHMFWRYTR